MLHRNTNRAVCWKDGMYKQCENRFLFQITVVVAVLYYSIAQAGVVFCIQKVCSCTITITNTYSLLLILWYLVGSNFDKESTIQKTSLAHFLERSFWLIIQVYTIISQHIYFITLIFPFLAHYTQYNSISQTFLPYHLSLIVMLDASDASTIKQCISWLPNVVLCGCIFKPFPLLLKLVLCIN